MEYTATEIKDVLLLKPSVFTDDRGFFFESYRRNNFKEKGLNVQFVQDNVSSSHRNALRGLHYQIEQPQDKLIMVLEGEILDVAVDLRQSSDSFGEAVSRVLSADNKHQLFVPGGFAHGFRVLSKTALVYYKCSDYYCPGGERGLRWDDPALGIEWGIDDPIVSEKDQQQPCLNEIPDTDLFE